MTRRQAVCDVPAPDAMTTTETTDRNGRVAMHCQARTLTESDMTRSVIGPSRQLLNEVPGIAGIGMDLIYLHRIRAAYEKRGRRFATRILGAEELATFERRHARDAQRGLRYLATRFAAKEAFSKAIGLGMRSPMAWRRMQTLNLPGGKPHVVLSEPLASWYASRFGAAHVSVTDESDTVAAFVVVQSRGQETPPIKETA